MNILQLMNSKRGTFQVSQYSMQMNITCLRVDGELAVFIATNDRVCYFSILSRVT